MRQSDLDKYLKVFGFTSDEEGLYSRGIGDNGLFITAWVGEEGIHFEYSNNGLLIRKVINTPKSKDEVLHGVSSFTYLIYKIGVV